MVKIGVILQDIINKVRKYYTGHPLRAILLAGLFFRLLSVIFSKGFGWIDDQFLVIEIAQSWVDGTDFYKWLPWTPGNNGPAGFSFFYPGLHYLLFKLLEWVRITDPQAKMYVVRMLHALWSLLTIKYGYELTLHYSNKKTANRVGWLLALFWMFPFLSVHNLVEFVCVPLLMKAILMIARGDKKSVVIYWLWAGFIFGLAFDIRYQTVLISGAVGLVMLTRNQWKEGILVAIGFLLSVVLIQGGIDFFVWGKPFAQLQTYFLYNINHASEYTTGPWYNYILFLLAVLIPPVSLYLLFGFFRSYRKLFILFLPILVFFAFHSWYPNKQERFITTLIPFIFISGIIGWQMIVDGLFNPVFIKKWIRASWIFFWVVNFILLIPVSLTYSKKARVESMSYLSAYPSLNYFIIEDINKDVLRFPPQFYLKKWIHYDALLKNSNKEAFLNMKDWSQAKNQPGFVLFLQPDNLDQRVKWMKKVFPGLQYETTIQPGWIDKILHWLNPINDNQNIYIYRNKTVMLKKKTYDKNKK